MVSALDSNPLSLILESGLFAAPGKRKAVCKGGGRGRLEVGEKRTFLMQAVFER